MYNADSKQAPSTWGSVPHYPDQENKVSFGDDIDCWSWLREVNMTQYVETFLVNLSADGKTIKRNRLGQIRQQDLSSMSITNYAHQKRLMEHIRLVLKYSFNSPVRKKEMKVIASKLPDLATNEPPRQVPNLVIDAPAVSTAAAGPTKEAGSKGTPYSKDTNSKLSKEPVASKQKKLHARRRRSFDSSVWNSISTSRRKSENVAAVTAQLRDGMFSNPGSSSPVHNVRSHSQHAEDMELQRVNALKALSSSNDENDGVGRPAARRWSFHAQDAEGHAKIVQAAQERAKALMYGNMALEYDIMLSNLAALQNEFLNKFKETINCEVASIFFLNSSTQELLLYANDSKWYRIPVGVGIAGYCAESGESLNIPDAYKDYRFNKGMDQKTGFHTRSILCQPLRSMRGGGPIIGVIQLLNKIGQPSFDQNDVQTLASGVENVADMLSNRFTDLSLIGEKFSGQAIIVGGTSSSNAGRSYASETTTSLLRKNQASQESL